MAGKSLFLGIATIAAIALTAHAPARAAPDYEMSAFIRSLPSLGTNTRHLTAMMSWADYLDWVRRREKKPKAKKPRK